MNNKLDARYSKLSVPYANLALQHQPIKADLLKAVENVINHGRFILGEEVDEFERQFAQLCGTKYAIAVNSGTDALILSLRALEIGPGDEVITVANSFVASASCIALVGAKPVFVDVLEDMNMDWSKFKSVLNIKTKAILPVHLTGLPAEMDQIMAFAIENNLKVIEDCAQAVNASFNGRMVGSFGNTGCFSMHPLKTLNACGDGGVVTTNDEEVFKKLKVLRNIGLETRDHCREWSGNSRLDTIQAAMLLVKMKHLAGWTAKRQANALFYIEALSGIKALQLPLVPDHKEAVFHTFVVKTAYRDQLKDYLHFKGVGTNIHYPLPIHLHAAAAYLNYKSGDFPVTEQQSKQILSLPVYPELTTGQLNYVTDTIKFFFKEEIWKGDLNES